MKDENNISNSGSANTGLSWIKRFGYVISLLIIAGILLAVYWFGESFYKNFFVAQSQPFSLNLSNFKLITVLGKEDCQMGDGPVFLVLSRPFNKVIFQEVAFESDTRADFQITFPHGFLSAKGYKSDNSAEDIGLTKTEAVTFSGKMSHLNVEYLNLASWAMKQSFCAKEVFVQPNPSAYFMPLSKGPKSVWIEQTLAPQNKIRVKIYNPDISNMSDARQYEWIEFEFTASESFLTFNVGAGANDLNVTVPTIMHDFGKYPYEMMIIRSQQYQIQHPVGLLKFGNSQPITLDEVTTTSEDNLTIFHNTYYFPGNPLNSTSSNKYEITGMADNLILNNEEKIQPRWYSLPEYFQAGLFGFLLSIIGGLWTLRESIGKWILSLFPFLKPKLKLTKGSFVIVMNSGFVIAGELSRKPAQNYPYYLLKNARRKSSLSGDWEEEIISEIKIRADAVDQSYVV